MALEADGAVERLLSEALWAAVGILWANSEI